MKWLIPCFVYTVFIRQLLLRMKMMMRIWDLLNWIMASLFTSNLLNDSTHIRYDFIFIKIDNM